MLGLISLTAAAFCAMAYLWLAGRPAGALRSATKTAAVMLLALAAGLGGAPILLVLALVCCALGDFCLSRDGERYFMAGVGFFALGHLGYIILFLSHSDSNPMRLLQLPQLTLGLMVVGLGLATAWVLAPRAGPLKGPVLCYIPIIMGMGLAALTVPEHRGLVWLLPAALAFSVSDLVLATETFILPADHLARRFTPYVIWMTYWGAQVGFFATFA